MPEQENNILDAPQEPLLTRIDAALTHGIKLVIKIFYQAFLWILGISLTTYILADIFEGSAWLDELSHEEMIFLLASAVLIRRTFRHCSLRGYRWWSGLHRLTTSIGTVTLALFWSLGMITLLFSTRAKGPELIAELLVREPIPAATMILHALFLAGIFLSIPTRNKKVACNSKFCSSTSTEAPVEKETAA